MWLENNHVPLQPNWFLKCGCIVVCCVESAVQYRIASLSIVRVSAATQEGKPLLCLLHDCYILLVTRMNFLCKCTAPKYPLQAPTPCTSQHNCRVPQCYHSFARSVVCINCDHELLMLLLRSLYSRVCLSVSFAFASDTSTLTSSILWLSCLH